MRKNEEKLKEERTFEATQKNLMGINGRLGTIVRYLGNIIMKEGSGLVDTQYLDDQWLLEDEHEEIATSDEEEISFPIGYVFDGLSRGMHIEIKFLEYRKELNVYYQGFEVFKETNGELEKYVPRLDWEEKIDYLFGVAKKVEKNKRKEMESFVKDIAKTKQAEYLEELRSKWGLKEN